MGLKVKTYSLEKQFFKLIFLLYIFNIEFQPSGTAGNSLFC